jgi:hypothetical protein
MQVACPVAELEVRSESRGAGVGIGHWACAWAWCEDTANPVQYVRVACIGTGAVGNSVAKSPHPRAHNGKIWESEANITQDLAWGVVSCSRPGRLIVSSFQ